MAPFKSEPLRIVQTRSGQGTLETVYTAEDGSEWITNPHPLSYNSGTCSPERGRIIGNRIYR